MNPELKEIEDKRCGICGVLLAGKVARVELASVAIDRPNKPWRFAGKTVIVFLCPSHLNGGIFEKFLLVMPP